MAFLLNNLFSSFFGVPALARPPGEDRRRRVYFAAARGQPHYLEYIDDSGAGRHIGSEDALVEQGFARSDVRAATNKASASIIFDTGGGAKTCDRSIGITSPGLGHQEMYMLKESPIAISMGSTVIDQGFPFIWNHPDLPYHCTDPSKLTITCPTKCRRYAHRVDNYVPIFREQVDVVPRQACVGAAYFNKGVALPGPANPERGDETRVPQAGDGDPSLDEELMKAFDCPSENVNVDEVPLVEGEAASSASPPDPTARTRSMSRRELLLEAASMKHRASHFPHNPLCEVCRRAHLRQRRYARRSAAEDDLLPAPTGPFQQLSSDNLIISKSKPDRPPIRGDPRASSEGDITIHTVRDYYSGVGMAWPGKGRDENVIFSNLKFFCGIHARRPNILVRSDAAREITSAVSNLGWIAEPSLENRWPHNAVHERWQATLKSVIRAAKLQSGIPTAAWHLLASYAAISLAITQDAPIYPHERGADGRVLDQFSFKLGRTCWEVLSKGDPFTGPLQPFGRLCYYWNHKAHPLDANGAPALFIGWRIESNMRYRGVLLVIRYYKAKEGDWSVNSIIACPEKEVFFPKELTFPFAVAADTALRNLTDLAGPEDVKPIEFDLPFAVEAGDGDTGVVSSDAGLLGGVASRPPRTRVTVQRVARFGPTKNKDGTWCKACTQGEGTHSKDCQARFRRILQENGEITGSELVMDVKPPELPNLSGLPDSARPDVIPAEPLSNVIEEPVGDPRVDYLDDDENIFGNSDESDGDGPVPRSPVSAEGEAADSASPRPAPHTPLGFPAPGTPPGIPPPENHPRFRRTDVVDLTPARALLEDLQIQLVSKRAKMPVRATEGSAGLDLSASECVLIPAESQARIPLGFKVALPTGTYGRIAPRSGLALRHFIQVGAGVIDPDYREEVGVVLFNHGKHPFQVNVGDRVAQLILELCLNKTPRQVQALPEASSRRGGFGSTGVNKIHPQGVKAAVACVDDALAAWQREFEGWDAAQVAQDIAAEVKLAACLDKTARKLRPGAKLSGYGSVLHIGGQDGNSLTDFASEYEDVKTCIVESLSPEAPDMEGRLTDWIRSSPGAYILIDVPHACWRPSEWKRRERGGAKAYKAWAGEQSRALEQLRRLLRLADLVFENGGEVTIRAPADCSVWLRPEMIAFVSTHALRTCAVYKNPPGDSTVNKKWRYCTSHSRTAADLSCISPEPFKGYSSASNNILQRTISTFNRLLLSSIFGFAKHSPAMAVVLPKDYGHIDHYSDPSGMSAWTATAMVTALLDRKDWIKDKEALRAVEEERQKLLTQRTWLEDTVRERDEVVAEARARSKDGRPTLHIGQLMSICSIKFAELAKKDQKYKGRIVFRGDSVKDEHGAAAVFQELSAQPTSIATANANIAYGSLPGHTTTQADARSAYLQSVLKSKHPTWVAIPFELWPQAWRGRYTKPMCRLHKALYGHPESGAHWEKHLEAAIKKLGGVGVEAHPSTFWFKEYKLLLTVYVDDLLLSGPEKHHATLWDKIGKEVDLDPWEPLNRFIGRDHQVLRRDKNGCVLAFDMSAFALDAVNQYSELSGCVKFKPAATPFCPDGSLPPSGECTRGELNHNACAVLMKNLWLARLARPDIQKPIGDMATHIQQWSVNDDKRMYRLLCYINSTKDHKLVGRVGDDAAKLKLRLYVDADFAGEHEDARSTNGGYLVLVGPNTWFPLQWVTKKQTSTSRSTTESEVVSLAYSLFSEALPALTLWDTVLERTMDLEILEDNQATIKVVLKGYSPKLRHMARTHKVNLSSIKEVIDKESVVLEYVKTDLQAADIFTKALPVNKWENALQLLGIFAPEALQKAYGTK